MRRRRCAPRAPEVRPRAALPLLRCRPSCPRYITCPRYPCHETRAATFLPSRSYHRTRRSALRGSTARPARSELARDGTPFAARRPLADVQVLVGLGVLLSSVPTRGATRGYGSWGSGSCLLTLVWQAGFLGARVASARHGCSSRLRAIVAFYTPLTIYAFERLRATSRDHFATSILISRAVHELVDRSPPPLPTPPLRCPYAFHPSLTHPSPTHTPLSLHHILSLSSLPLPLSHLLISLLLPPRHALPLLLPLSPPPPPLA